MEERQRIKSLANGEPVVQAAGVSDIQQATRA